MDKLVDKVVRLLGSGWVIVIFGAWMVVHTLLSFEYVAWISDVTFWTGTLILRNQLKDAKQQEIDIKSTEKATKRIEKKLDGRSSDGYQR